MTAGGAASVGTGVVDDAATASSAATAGGEAGGRI